jgi:triacylglycerol lipase
MKLPAALACCLGMLAAPAFSAAPAADVSTRETVVLLHGMGRTKASMLPLARALEHDGYRVVNLSYPSRTMPLETLAGEWLPQQLRDSGAATAPRLHFVTHSLGGILVRAWLRDQAVPANLGRVVMLAPPNAGSEVTDKLNTFPPYRWATGVNGRRLGTGADSLSRQLGDWPRGLAELGIIAGDRSLNPFLSACLRGPNDGKVTVAATHLAGEHGHVVVHHSHTWLGWRRDTLAQTKAFLRDGSFL